MTRTDSLVRMAEAASGARTYLIDMSPEKLPPVQPRDLHAAWDSARGAALAQQWGRPLMLRFRRHGAPAGEAGTELALADADACCWAAAVDGTVGLASAYGLSVCLRLLALVDLLRAPWARPMIAFRRDGAAIDPGLIRAAARTPLAADARLDAEAVRVALLTEARLAAPSSPMPGSQVPGSQAPAGHALSAPPDPSAQSTGARA